MALSKKIFNNIDLRNPKLLIGAFIIIAEVLTGILCLVTGYYVFILFFGGLLAALIFLFPKLGAILMLFFIPGVQYLNFDIGPVTISPLRILLIPTLIGAVLHIVVKKSSIKMAPIGAPVAALISVAILSILQSSHIGTGIIKLTFFLSLFSITFVLSQILDDRKWVEIAISVMIASSIILTILILMEAIFLYMGMPSFVSRLPRLAAGVTGRLYPTAHPMTLDLNTYLPFVLLLAASQRRWKSLLLVVLASCYILGIILAAAMAGWLATIGSVMILVIIGLSRTQGKAVKGVLKKLVLVLILGSLLVSLTIPSSTLEERIGRFVLIVTLTGIHTQRTEEVRIPVWAAAKNMFLDHPILGVGLGSMFYEYHKYMVERVGARGKEFTHHGFNMFVDIGTEMGILGIGAILWFLFTYAIVVLKHLPLIEDPFLSNMLLACFAASVAVVIQMQTETGPFWANNFWVLAGLSLAIINVAKTGQLEMQA